MRNPFTSPTFTKMSTSRTQNEITLKGSEIVFAKIKKAQSFTLSTFHSLLWLSSLALKKFESKTK